VREPRARRERGCESYMWVVIFVTDKRHVRFQKFKTVELHSSTTSFREKELIKALVIHTEQSNDALNDADERQFI